MSKRKTSSVWEFYSEELGTPFATCKVCNSRIKRGKDNDRTSWSSKPLWNHLEKKHRQQFQEASENRRMDDDRAKRRKIEEEERSAIYVNGTPKLQQFLNLKTKYVPDNPEQKELSRLLATWIADGVLPYQIIDNPR